MPRLVHKATDSLSAEARRIMMAGFRAKSPYRAIARQIGEETGEEVPERTVARRGKEWRGEQSRRRAAREQMQALVDAMKAGEWSAAEMIQALATDALMMNPEALTNADPLKVQAQNLRAEELRIKREEMELRTRQVAMDERKVEVLLGRERKAAQAADELKDKAGRGEQLTVEDLERIRSIYGLN